MSALQPRPGDRFLSRDPFGLVLVEVENVGEHCIEYRWRRPHCAGAVQPRWLPALAPRPVFFWWRAQGPYRIPDPPEPK
jgi:hypothetical protein